MSDDTEVSLDDLVGRTLTEVVAALKLTHCVPATRSESGMLATDGPEERIWNDDGLTVTLIERLWGWGPWRYRLAAGTDDDWSGMGGHCFVR